MSDRASWTPAPHDPIVWHTDNLWTVDGPVPRMPFGRRMSAIRMSTGQLVIHSAIAVAADALAEMEAWGEPAFLIVPNQLHRMDAPAFVRRFPDIRVLCPPACRDKVARRVRVDGDYTALPADPALRVELLDGSREREGAFIVTSGGEVSLVLNDAVFNLPDRLPGFSGFVTRLIGSTGGPKVTRIGKFALVADRAAFAGHLRRLADLPGLRRVVVSHGAIIDREPGDVLRQVADGLHR